MSRVYLNGEYMPAEEAKISPMDRGFLYGDGIYEVIPSFSGKMLGFKAHIERMKAGLAALEIKLDYSEHTWRTVCENLCAQNEGDDLGIYLHVSRGADTRRQHAYPDGLTPTVFAFTFVLPKPPAKDETLLNGFTVALEEDKRWQHCNIKSTALLGNVMHYQQGAASGNKETILYNRHGEITEASSSNVFIVKDGVIATPPLDNQKLPGITRWLVLTILRDHSDLLVEERVISKEELLSADEVWVTSSTKEIAPVTRAGDNQIADGKPGPVWRQAQDLFSRYKFDY